MEIMDFDSEELTPPKSPVLGYSGSGLKASADEIEDFNLDDIEDGGGGEGEADAQVVTSSEELGTTGSSSPSIGNYSAGPLSLFNCKGPVKPELFAPQPSAVIPKYFNEILNILLNETPSGNRKSNKKQKIDEDFIIDAFHLTPSPRITSTTSVPNPNVYNFFEFNFTNLQLGPSELKKLFLMCKKRIYTIENLTKAILPYGLGAGGSGFNRHRSDESELKMLEMRKEVVQFCNFLMLRETDADSEVGKFITGLRKCLEPVKSWSSSLQHHCGSKEGNNCHSPEYHFFHLSLELRLSLLILHKFSMQTVNWVLSDLLHLAHLRYKLPDLKVTDRSPFNCSCVKELWLVIKGTLDEIHKQNHNKNYWEILILQLSTTYESNSDCLFQIWLICHLVLLTTPSSQTNHNHNIEACNSYTNELLRKWIQIAGPTSSFSSRVMSEVQDLFRGITLMGCWGLDLNLITSFWNYWFIRIDKGSFEVRNLEPYMSPFNWLNLILQITTLTNQKYSMDSSSSYDEHISSDVFLNFLQLLVAQINCAALKDWRKIKSNIYNRLNRKIIEGYSEIGLMRLITLLLCMNSVAKDDPLLMSESLNELLNYGKEIHQKLIFRGRCTIMLLLLQRGTNITSISTSLMKIVDEIMGSMTRLPTQRDLILTYLDLIESIPKFSPNLDLGQSKLFSQNLQPWLASCGPNFVSKTLRVLHSIFDSWLISTGSVQTLEKSKIAETIYSKTEQYLKQSILSVKSIATTESSANLRPFGELAADLTIYLKSRNKIDEVNKLFELYVLHPRSPPSAIESYINALVTNEFFQSPTTSVLNEIKLTQAWIRLIILGKPVPYILTRKILPDYNELDSECVNDKLLELYCNFVSSEKYELSRCDLSTIFAPVGLTVKNLGDKLYEDDTDLECHIVKSSIIVLKNINIDKLYTKSLQNNILNQVLEVFVPTFLGKPPWERLSKEMTEVIGRHLSELFSVLMSTELWTNDSFLKRKLCDIFRFAFFGFVKGDELDSENPALLIMETIESLDPKLRTLLLNELMQSLQPLTKDDKLVSRFLMTTIGFLKRKMARAVAWLLQPIIELLIERDGENSARCITIVANVCCLILGREAYTKEFSCELKEAFDKTMKKHFAFRSGRIFDMFTSLANFGNKKPIVKKFVRESMLPRILIHIENSELKQGSGTNFAMRNSYRKLGEKLGVQQSPMF